LAPFLFVVVVDALGHMLEDQRYGVQGFTLPNGSEVTNVAYTDDMNLFLQGSRINLDKVRKVLPIFCLGSGSKIN